MRKLSTTQQNLSNSMNFSVLHDSVVNDIYITHQSKKTELIFAKLMENFKRMELEKMCVAVFTENADVRC